jgi:hypothetical protein
MFKSVEADTIVSKPAICSDVNDFIKICPILYFLFRISLPMPPSQFHDPFSPFLIIPAGTPDFKPW